MVKKYLAAKTFLVLAISFLWAGMALSQSIVRLPFSKKISTDEGLSSYNVKKNFQDKYGFIWIVTQGGLNRYDGKEFLVFNKSMDADHQLLASDVWDIEEDTARDILWVVSSYGGLNGINLKTAKVCFSLEAKISKEGFNHDWLRCLKIINDNLWIGTYDGLTIYNVVTKSFEKFEPLPFKKFSDHSFCIDKIFMDRYENSWLFIANYGIVVYSGRKKNIINYFPLTKLALEVKPTYKQFNSVLSLPNGDLLTGTNQGFRRISYTKAGITGVSTGLFDNDANYSYKDIEASGIDSSRYIWFSTSEKLLKANLNTRTIQEIKDARINLQNDWFNYIYDIFFDKDNNIWLGTGKGVTYTKNTVAAFTPFYVSEDQAIKIDHAYYIYPINDSVMYGCTETGLLKINVKENKITSLDSGRRYYFIAEHKDKNFLVSSEDSFFVFRPGDKRFFEVSVFYPELAPLKSISVNSITYADDSIAIIGTETSNGFYLWNYVRKYLQKLNAPRLADVSAANIVNTSFKDNKNRIWILGDKLISLYNLKTRQIKTVNLINPVSNIPFNLFFDVCEARGYYWIAAYGSGLIQVDNNFAIKKIFSTREGLSNAGVYKLFHINDSLIFITTNYGLSVLNLNTQLFSNYFKEDGLNSNAFEEGCGLFKYNKMYVGGLNGFTIIDPKYFRTNNIPPELRLNRIRIETASGFMDTSNSLLTTLTVPNNVLQATISISALNYSNPSRTTYAYKIADLNSNWIHLGTQSFVSLIGLSPGAHTLLIKSANENNVWNDKPLVLKLKYLPKWYQTLLFKILVFLSIAGLLYAFYAYRISQLKKQQKIRKDISVDLHDEMGHLINSAKNFTHLAQKEQDKEAYLNQIEDTLVQANVVFRDVIWILDDKEDTIYQFIERVKKFALPTTNAKKVHLECTIEPGVNEKTFTKDEKRHLLMIVKESITNSLKHAECKNIRVAIQQVNNKITILIEDDGKGFDMQLVSEGNGLKNMVYRAKQIGYRVEEVSEMGKGTKVRVWKI